MSKKNIRHNIISSNQDLHLLLHEKKEELKNFDMEFRPVSYWGLNTLSVHLLSSIKKEETRQRIKEFINNYGEQKLTNENFTKNKLNEEERVIIKRIEPHYSIEENTDNKNDEINVEIARLTMKSTLGDYISFRAKKNNNKITYSILDEYQGIFNLSIKSSKRPLSFKEIIKLIDESTSDSYMDYNYVYGGARQSNYDDNDYDPEEYWDFETIDSNYYNQLYEWYNIQNWIWLIKRKLEIINK